MTTSSGIRLRRLAYAILGIASLLPCQLHSQTNGAVAVTGRIPEAFQLQVAAGISGDPRISVQVVPFGPNAILIKMNVPKSVRTGKLSVPLAMRTNAERYALRAKPAGTPFKAMLSASHPRNTGDGALLLPGAAESFDSHVTSIAAGSLIASGTRISRRGNGSTPNNALVTDLELSFEGLSADATDRQLSVIVSMERL